VDDNRDAADSLVTLLRCLGYESRAAYNGEAALHVATEFAPGVVLLDLRLPGLSGYEVARRLRTGPLSASLIVAVTGMDGDETTARVKEAGFNCHLVKPVDPSRLEAMLAGARFTVR
jgi:CheY-like chemotaxis protein